MKKALLASTAIVTAAALASPASAADRIKLSLGGYMEQYIGFISPETDNSTVQGNRRDLANFDQQSDTEIWFSGSTTLDNGIKLAVRIELEGEASAASANYIDESWLDIQTAWGTLRLGADDSVADLQSVEPRKGQDLPVSDYNNWIPTSFGSGVANGITTADDAYVVRNSADDNQILYLTPKIAGFQAGFSYAPDIGTGGRVATPNRGQGAASTTAATLNWDGKIGDFSIATGYAYTHETGTGAAATAQGFVNHNVGMNVNFAGFGVGANYGRQMEKNGFNGAGNTVASQDGYNYKIGAWYIAGPMEVGYNHLVQVAQGDKTNSNHDKSTVDGVFFDYTLSDGVIWESLLFHVNYDEEHNVDATEQSGGWGAVTGIVVKF